MAETDWKQRALDLEAENATLKSRIDELEGELDILASRIAKAGNKETTKETAQEFEPLRVIDSRTAVLETTPKSTVAQAAGGSNCLSVALRDPTTFAVAGADSYVRYWSKDEVKAKLKLPAPAIAMQWAPSRKCLCATTMDGRTHLLEASSKDELTLSTSFKDHEKFVVACDFAPDGSLLATCARDKSVCLYTRTSQGFGYTKSTSFVLPNNPECLRFSPDGTTLIIAARQEPFLRYVDVATLQETRVSLNNSPWDTHVSFDVLHLAVSPDNYLVAATSKDRHIVYKLHHHAHVRLLTGHASDDFANTRVAFLGVTSIVSSSCDADNALLQWDFGSGKLLTKISQAHNQVIRNLDVLPSHNLLATTSFDKFVKLWSLADSSSSSSSGS